MDTIEIIMNRLDVIESDLKELKNNHFHDVEIRLERIDMTLKLGWKIMVFGAGLPAFISTVLTLVQLLK